MLLLQYAVQPNIVVEFYSIPAALRWVFLLGGDDHVALLNTCTIACSGGQSNTFPVLDLEGFVSLSDQVAWTNTHTPLTHTPP